MPRKATTAVRAESRAVLRVIEPGTYVLCTHCGERIKYRSAQKVRPRQVICNVYENGVWNRTEHFHAECYETAGEPHGSAAAPIRQAWQTHD